MDCWKVDFMLRLIFEIFQWRLEDFFVMDIINYVDYFE